MNIGHTLRSLRLMKSYTLEDLSLKTGLSKSYISRLEKNKRNVNFSSLEKICNAIQIPLPVIVFLSASDEDLNDNDHTLSKLKLRLQEYVKDGASYEI